MKEDLNIEELFQQKFEGFEGEVNPDVWANISQSIGTTATTTATTAGLSTMAKVAIVSGGIIIASVAGVMIYNSGSEEDTPKEDIVKVEEDQPLADTDIVPEEEQTTLLVQDTGDALIEPEKEEIAKTKKENEVQEIEITDEEVDRIIEDTKINAPNPIMFDIIGERGQNPVKEDNAEESDNGDKDAAGKEDNSSQASNDTPKEEVIVQPLEEIEEEVAEIEQEEQIPNEKCVIVPNIFTPNDDFRNDVWSVKTTDIEVFVINLRDRNGKIVYTSNDKEFTWDGTDMSGVKVEAGEYYYVIVSERGSNGEKLVTQGSVTVKY